MCVELRIYVILFCGGLWWLLVVVVVVVVVVVAYFPLVSGFGFGLCVVVVVWGCCCCFLICLLGIVVRFVSVYVLFYFCCFCFVSVFTRMEQHTSISSVNDDREQVYSTFCIQSIIMFQICCG